MEILITSEHATNFIPHEWDYLFETSEAQADLNSHLGWDPGTFELGLKLKGKTNAPFISGMVSRLLVELNRTVGHPQFWSKYTLPLPEEAKDHLLKSCYHPYRKEVRSKVVNLMPKGMVLHLALHSFTPVWKGAERQVDIGLLFDPTRHAEAAFCESLHDLLLKVFPGKRICYNEPYPGIDDGLPTTLRTQFTADQYLGIELEINQAWITDPSWLEDRNTFINALLKIAKFPS